MEVIIDLFCVYLTTYMGDKLPSFYVGSTSVEKLENGYRGSVSSKRYKEIWELELTENPHLFKYQIMQYCKTRKEALAEELYWQLQFDVVKSPDFINMSLAKKNGYYGSGLKGSEHHSYGLSKESHPGMKALSDLFTGQTKENCDRVKRQAETRTGWTKETHAATAAQATAMTGRTRFTHESVEKHADAKRNLSSSQYPNLIKMKKDNLEDIKIIEFFNNLGYHKLNLNNLKNTYKTALSELATPENGYLEILNKNKVIVDGRVLIKRAPRCKKAREKLNILSLELRKEVIDQRDAGISFKIIHKWLLSLNIEIAYSTLPQLYKREKDKFKTTLGEENE